jgi:hypothetical protein
VDPNSGRVYSMEEYERLPKKEQDKLVMIEGRPADIQMISTAVAQQNARNKRRAKNRVARKSRKKNR